MNINIEHKDDNYYDKFKEEISPRTNYGDIKKVIVKDSSEITEQIAIEFAEWIYDNYQERYISHEDFKELYQEFLKTKL